MGRASRLKAEGRLKRAAAASALLVTVVAHPEQDAASRKSISNEMVLVRAAILYADSVELVSQDHVYREVKDALARAVNRTREEILRPDSHLIEDYIQGSLSGTQAGVYQKFIDDAIRNNEIPRYLGHEHLRRALRPIFDRYCLETEQERVRENKENGLEETRALERLNLLRVSDGGLASVPLPNLELLSPMAWWEEVRNLLEDGTARLLLDSRSQSVVRKALDQKVVSPSALFEQRTTATFAGAGLIARLPAFPEVPLDELLDLRKDLSDPLVRYRTAAARMSKQSGLAIGPDANAQIDDLWVNEVEPAILAIKEQMHDHGLMRELARTACDDIKTYLAEGTAIVLGLGTLTGIAGWASTLLGMGAPSAQASVQAWKSSHDGQLAAQRSDLFYLYEARRRLSG